MISNIMKWPEPGTKGVIIEEPVVKVVIVTPSDHYGAIVEIVKNKRGEGYMSNHIIIIMALKFQ